jgi:hypothetical protein
MFMKLRLQKTVGLFVNRQVWKFELPSLVVGGEFPTMMQCVMIKPDPELLPIRPRCPKCKNRIVTVDVAAGPEGFERRSFECRRCGCKETKMIACDPMKSDAVGWLSGELGNSIGSKNF